MLKGLKKLCVSWKQTKTESSKNWMGCQLRRIAFSKPVLSKKGNKINNFIFHYSDAVDFIFSLESFLCCHCQ